MAGYSGAHSGLSANSGVSSSADRVWTGFIFHGNSLNAYYSRSDGIAVFGSTGLVSVPTTVPTELLNPGAVTSYRSTGWGGSLGLSPTKRLIVTASYGKSDGSTIDPMLSIFTNNTIISGRVEYRLRKVFLNGGYTRLQQSVGTPGSTPLEVTSYYAGISRWFNFF